MAEEVKKIITVEVGKSITSVRDFKKHIEDLRGALLGLNEESDEYKQIAEQIATDQAKLNEVMSVGKTNTDAAAGSYVELNNQLKSLRQQYKALSETERNGATGQAILSNITKLDTELKNIDESMGQYQRNVGNYKSAFDGAFKMISSEVGKINPTLGNLLNAVQQLVPAFKGVGTAAKATGTSIKSAMASTGIGLLVVALGEIISHWKEIATWVSKALGLQNQYTKSVQQSDAEVKKLVSDLSSVLSYLNAIGRAQGKDDLEIAESEKRAIEGLRLQYEGLLKIRDLGNEVGRQLNGWHAVDRFLDPLKTKEKIDNLSYAISSYITVLKLADKPTKQFEDLLQALNDYDMTSVESRKKVQDSISSFARSNTDAFKKAEEELAKIPELAAQANVNIQVATENMKTNADKAKKDADKSLLSAKDRLKAEYDENVKYYEDLADRRVITEKKKNEILKSLEAKYNADLKKLQEDEWKGSQAYADLQEYLKKREEVHERVKNYDKSELQLLEEKFTAESALFDNKAITDEKLIKQNAKDLANLTKEFMDNRHKIITDSQYETIDELKNVYAHEIELRKLYGLEYEDLEKELQDRITALVLDKYRKRLQEERAILEQGLQDQNSWTNLQLQALETIRTRTDRPKWDIFNFFPGGEEDIQKVNDLQDKIFEVEQQGYMDRIDMYHEYLSKVEEGSEEFFEIQKRLQEEQMGLAQLNFERQEQLEDRMLEKRRRNIAIASSLNEAYGQAAVAVFSAIADGEQEGTERWKALKITEVSINTLSGIANAFLSAMSVQPPWLGIAIGTANAIAAGATGAAQIAKIRATKVGSSSTSDFSTPSVSGAAVEPLLNPDYDLQRMTNLSLQSDAFLPGKTQVYVLESDIQEVGNRVQVRENNATF